MRSPSVAMTMTFWVWLKWYWAPFSLKKLITSLTRCRAACRLVPVFSPWPEHEHTQQRDRRRSTEGQGRTESRAPTVVVELPQIPDDVVRASAYVRLGDVHDVLGLASEGQHVEFQLHFVAVQLEGDTKGLKIGTRGS